MSFLVGAILLIGNQEVKAYKIKDWSILNLLAIEESIETPVENPLFKFPILDITEKVNGPMIQESKESTPPPAIAEPENEVMRYSSINAYPFGQCTWYVKDYFGSRVGDNWGNAINWPAAAAADSLQVDDNPEAESTIAVFGVDEYNMGYGHVAVVIAVNGDYVTISEMNYGGPGQINQRTVHISEIMAFIHV